MKFNCEHCGALIDTSKDKKCPNCGAPYSKNKEYKEAKELNKKEKEVSIQSKELGNKIVETTLKQFTFVRIFQLFFILVFVIILIVGIVTMANTKKKTNEMMKEYTQVIDNSDDEEEPLFGVFNENIDNQKYEIKCDKVSNYEYDFYETEKYRGNEIDYYKFHIVFKNKDSAYRILREIYLTYTDDNGNENIVAKIHNPNTKENTESLSLLANKDVTYSGYLVFEIPKYVKDVTIKYQNVNIKIEDFKDKISK